MTATPPASPRIRPPNLRTSSRTSSIRRKPVPLSGDEYEAQSSAESSAGDFNSPRQGSAFELRGPEAKEELSSALHIYSNPPRRSTSTSSRPADPYSASSPVASHPPQPFPSHTRNLSSTSNASLPPDSHAVPISTALPPPGSFPLTSRPSLRSNRSSIAAESVFGTTPQGVIGKTKPREVIRIERDYGSGETTQFWQGWIYELEGRVSPTDFQNTLNELNATLASAHDPCKSIFDNCLAVLTLYISPYLLTSHYEREIRKFHQILERANRDIFNPRGLNILSPQRNAYLYLEVEYY